MSTVPLIKKKGSKAFFYLSNILNNNKENSQNGKIAKYAHEYETKSAL